MKPQREICLGINWEQNSTAALMIDDKIVGCVSEERFTNIKNDERYPKNAIDWLLKEFNVKKNEISSVNFISNFWSPTYSLIRHYTGFKMNDYIYEQKKVWFPKIFQKKNVSHTKVFKDKLDLNQYPGKKFWKYYLKKFQNHNDHTSNKKNLEIGKKIRSEVVNKHLQIRRKNINFIDHSTGHALYAYFSKKNDSKKTLVLTLDAFGDYVNYSAKIFNVSKKNKLEIKNVIKGNDFIIGRLYRYVTLIMGLKPNEHEYKVMGLAPYAKKEYTEELFAKFKKIQEVKNINFKYINRPKDLYFSIKSILDNKRFDTIASSLQQYTEYLVLKWVKNLLKKTSINEICLAGGVAMNVKTNMLISKISKKVNLFVPICPDDASQAMGACYASLLDRENINFKSVFLKNAYLGPQAQFIKKKHFNRLRKLKYSIIRKNFIYKTARMLYENKIIGRYVGKSEFGARALGNRSILANPKNPEIKNKINEKIKSRDFWMPFAASVLESSAKKYFILDNKIQNYKFMTNCVQTTNLGQKKLSAAIHPYDKTCRPQILNKNDNILYENLIEEFGKLSGTYALLNTSFNLHGFPIIKDLNQALNILIKSNLDGLLLENCLILKNEN